ncbi:MAG: hypothetical protein DRN49_04960 [Thaumarchaeota archaeon]|nr:MAG: hypothetical protein DRN49_04960 [Nitrososphaerota archaeon]
MIEGVLAGLFRQGTTILWYICKLSTPDKLHLYEPCHQDLFDILSKWEKGMKDQMHKLPLWDDYLEIPCEHLEIMRQRHDNFNGVIEWNKQLEQYMDAINAIPAPCILQPCRLNFVLFDIKLRYGCEIVAIVRNPIDTWFAHFPYADIDHLMSMSFDKIDGDPFYTNDFYTSLQQKYDLPPLCNFEQFAIVWTLANYYAICASDAIISYDRVVEHPAYEFMKINRKCKTMQFDVKYADLIKKYTHIYDDKIRRKFEIRLEQTVAEFGIDAYYDRVMQYI